MSKQAPIDGEVPIEQIAGDAVAIVIPMLNEAAVMPRLLRLLAVLGKRCSGTLRGFTAVQGGCWGTQSQGISSSMRS